MVMSIKYRVAETLMDVVGNIAYSIDHSAFYDYCHEIAADSGFCDNCEGSGERWYCR